MRTIIARSMRIAGLAAGFILACAGPAWAQPAPIPMRHVQVEVDSGMVAAPPVGVPGVAVPVFSTWVSVPGAAWLHLKFDQVVLAGDPGQGTGSFLKMTSAFDGAVQTMDARHLPDWGFHSAVFNGGAVLLQIYAYPGTGENRVTLSEVMASDGPPAMPENLCGTRDNRVRSSDPRQGRLWSPGCTAWLIDRSDCANRFLTAGHCIPSNATGRLVQFNVPLSLPDGTPQAPPPEDQFPVLPASIQRQDVGTGFDHAQFFTGVNSNTGLHARVHMGGGAYTLAAAAPGGRGQTVRVTGYGSTVPTNPPGGGLPFTLSLVQKTHTGPYDGWSQLGMRFEVDITGGNSGSPVVTESDGLAIGIATHGLLSCSGRSRTLGIGTPVHQSVLQAFLTNPIGPCAPMCPGTGAGACSRADWDANGVVDFNDLLAFLNGFNAADRCADVDLDGVVDFNDFLAFINLYVAGC